MGRRTSWSLLEPKALLKQFMLVYILRRHCPHMPYELMARKWPALFEHFPICISACSGAHAEPRFETVTVDVLHVLTTMKINIEDSDVCSRLQDQIFERIAGCSGAFVEQLVTLSITYFGSRFFHRTLYNFCSKARRPAEPEIYNSRNQSRASASISPKTCSCTYPRSKS